MEQDWHHLSIAKVFKQLGSNARGLTAGEAEKRLKKHGLNRLPSEKSLTSLRILIGQLKSPLLYILFAAGLITLLLGQYTDSLIIFIVVILNTGIGYLQEAKASQALTKLKQVLRFQAICLRDGAEKQIPQSALVPGDIIFLRAGDKVPADARLTQVHDLHINESALTGEWLAAEKKTSILPKGTSLADRDNMVYMGTIAASGWGQAVITATGLKTELGKVAEVIKETEEGKTPYQKKLARFSKIIGVIVVCISAVIFVEGLITGEGMLTMFTTAVAVAVAAIPEGLPVAMTVVLALGMQKILKQRGLVRKLASAETLGATSIILTDKTGTLTEAKMAVAGIFAGKHTLLSAKEKFIASHLKPVKQPLRRTEKEKNGRAAHVHNLALEIGMLCNESFVENVDDPMEKWIIRGRPTEKPLFSAAIQGGVSFKRLQKEQPVIDRALFDPTHKYAASLHKISAQQNILYMVGSPERLLEMSAYLHAQGGADKLLLKDFQKIKEKQEILTEAGYRVVGLAYRRTQEETIDRKKEGTAKKMVFVGFVALHDPIRKNIDQVMSVCRQAGMRPIIVTGDHKLTALAVAKKLGFKVKKENILEGKELTLMSDKDFKKRFRQIQIYARVEPKQKMRIVRAWQETGGVVAMTGDGINDAPALKQADIGVALGSGTDVAKEVSDLVLLKDNFRTIKAAVEEGRAIIDNIRKIIVYLLSDSFSEVILISVGLMFGWPLPLLAGQILWVNLIEDGPMGICLAFEKKEKDIMKRQPRDYGAFLLNREMKVLIFIIGLITDILLLGLFFFLFKYSGYTITHIRTVIFAGLTIDSLFYIFSCKSLRRNIWDIKVLSNKYIIAAWAFGIVMLVGAIYLAPLQSLLHTVPLNGHDWLLVAALGLANLFLIETTKFFFVSKHAS